MHIPKTAGTSLRNAFEARLPEEAIVRDYGPEAPETDGDVRDLLTGRIDLVQFRAQLTSRRTKLLMGHFHAQRYYQTFPDATWVTFVREPVARVFSAYRHHLRTKEFAGSFEAYMQQPGLHNQQFRMFGPHLDDFDFIGLVEYYSADLQALSRLCGFSKPLPVKHSNKPPVSGTLTEQDRRAAEAVNREDLRLYDELRLRREARAVEAQPRSLFERLRARFSPSL